MLRTDSRYAAGRAPLSAGVRFSAMLPFTARHLEEVLPFAALVHRLGTPRLWQGQSMHIEPHHQGVVAAGAGLPIPMGIGVALMPFRHPIEAAVQARSAAVISGHPMVAGYGPGSLSLQVSLMGSAYSSQIGASREYLTIMRGLLAGTVVEFHGEFFHCHAGLPPMASPPVELALGVLRKRMAQLAGEVADAAITWLSPASYIREQLRPAMAAGAQSAGRPEPRIVAMIPVALREPGRDAVDLALASNSAHLAAPHYQDMLRRSGVRITGDDRRSDAAAAVTGGAFLYGDAEELQGAVAEFVDAGVDEVVFNLTGVSNTLGAATALRELETLFSVFGVKPDAAIPATDGSGPPRLPEPKEVTT